jgi:peptidoglycan/xylan/chitin deacetylase (PgdA/CDA1 family)
MEINEIPMRQQGNNKASINFLTLFLLGIFILSIGVVAYYFTLLIASGSQRLEIPAKITKTERGNASSTFRPVGDKKTKRENITQKNLEKVLENRKSASDVGQTFRAPLTIGILLPEVLPTPDIAKANLSEWINFCTKENIQYETIQIRQRRILPKAVDVLILPFNPSLSDWAITYITNFLNQGGGLIAVGDCGAMDENGHKREISFLNRVIGITKVKPLFEPDSSPFKFAPLTIKANSPLSINLPLGARIGISASYGCVQAQVIEERTIQDGYWYEPYVTQGIPSEEIKNSTGLCHGSYNKGRFVWFGFAINSITGDEFSQNVKQQLIRNALLWVSQKPLARIKPWPANYECACIISGDIEHNFDNVTNVIKILKEKNIKGTFFLLSELANSNKSLVKAIANAGEIGLHGSSHIEFKGLPYEVQLNELQKSKATLERITRRPITGFRPPYGGFDENTLRALNKTGLKYLLRAIADGNSLEPELPDVTSGLLEVIVLPKPNKDDYDIFYRDSITAPEAIFNELKDEFDRIYDLGGYYVLTYHTQILAKPPNYPIVAQMIDYMKSRKTWFVTGQEFTERWRRIKNIKLVIKEKDSFNFDIVLSNFSPATVEDIQIQVFPGNLFTDPAKIQPQEAMQRFASSTWYFDEKTKSYIILIKQLKPKATHRINFTLKSYSALSELTM